MQATGTGAARTRLVRGQVAPELRGLTDGLAGLVRDGLESGCALVVVRDGRRVVDLQAGWTDRRRVAPFGGDTLCHVFSVSKPVVTLAALHATHRAGIDIDEPVALRWSAYAAAGKQATTVRQLLGHQAGLSAWPTGTAAGIHDTAALTTALERAAPEWPPGQGHGEHALTYGHLVDGYLGHATGTGLAEWLTRLRGAVGIPDLHLGVPEPDLGRVADLAAGETGWPGTVTGPAGTPWHRALSTPRGALDPAVLNSAAWRRGSFGAIGVHATARSLAALYADLLDPTGRVAAAVGTRGYRDFLTPSVTGIDQVFGLHASWGLGIPVRTDEQGRVAWFGMGGVGGSLAYADPRRGIAFAYVTRHLATDDRATGLATSVAAAVDSVAAS